MPPVSSRLRNDTTIKFASVLITFKILSTSHVDLSPPPSELCTFPLSSSTSTMSTGVSRHRQPRLRASCDGCFLAKVKCSKARPICSRCLTCGIECRYSSSSRAGKPKADISETHNHHVDNGNGRGLDGPLSHLSGQNNHHYGPPFQQDLTAIAAGFSPLAEDKGNLLYAAAALGMTSPPGLYRPDPGWQSPSGFDALLGDFIPCNQSISSELALLAVDKSSAAMTSATAAVNSDVYAAGTVPWTTPPTNLSLTQIADSSMGTIISIPSVVTREQFTNTVAVSAPAPAGIPWMDHFAIEMVQYQPSSENDQQQITQQQQQQQQQKQKLTPGSRVSSPINSYIPSPATTPSRRQSPATGHKSMPLSSYSSNGGNTFNYADQFGLHFLQPSQPLRTSMHHDNSSDNYTQTAQISPCACFTACLHALQALDDASTPTVPSFDVALLLNRNAIDGCANLLACSRCISRSGTHTSAMLLATLLGKITSLFEIYSRMVVISPAASSLTPDTTTSVSPIVDFFQASSRRFTAGSCDSGVAVSLVAYHLQGEYGRWLKREKLRYELNKLQEVYVRFSDVCSDLLFEDVAVSKAIIGYLGQCIGTTLELVKD